MNFANCSSERDLISLLKASGLLNALGYFLVTEEWEVVPGHSQYGKGDLLYFDGKGCVVVVEVKYLDPPGSGSTAQNRRTKKRSQVRDQALRYADHIRRAVGEAVEVRAAIFTNDWLRPGLIWL
ncbi:MAG TPA: hypothetical protein PLA94_30330 [Myxococcota bacterium]|nr:hypothetical protein [Myxococcota bacterium]